MGAKESKPAPKGKAVHRSPTSVEEQNSEVVAFTSELASLASLGTNHEAFEYLFKSLPFKGEHS